MDHQHIDAIAHQAGALPEALTDIRARVQAHFPEADVSPQAVERWLSTTLREAAPHLFAPAQTVWARLGMSEEAFNVMPPAWRLAQGRSQPTSTPHPNRPVPKDAPADVQEGWKDLSLSEQVTAYRAWVAAQQPQG